MPPGWSRWRRARLGSRRLRRQRRGTGRRGIARPIALGVNQDQVRDAHEAILAGERQRLIAALLLGESRDPVLAGVIDADLPSLLDRQLARAGKAGVPEIILSASGGGTAQFGRPPLAGRPAPPRTD